MPSSKNQASDQQRPSYYKEKDMTGPNLKMGHASTSQLFADSLELNNVFDLRYQVPSPLQGAPVTQRAEQR